MFSVFRRTAAPTLSEELTAEDDALIGSALKGSLIAIAAIGLIVVGIVYWRTRQQPSLPTVATPVVLPQTTLEPPNLPSMPFTDVTRQAGIEFVHENGAYGDKLLPETMGGGCAFFDFDNDGDQDLLLVNSARWPWDMRPGDLKAKSALYRNDGRGNFADVSAEAGFDVHCYGMGVAVGDYDNDGWVDVFISALGPNRLLRNNHGRFEDVTERSGVAGASEAWSTACGWFDFDNDGDLDLCVCNYLAWSKELDLAQNFRLTGVGRAYGPPTAFGGSFVELYRNEGDGRFVSRAAEAGLQVRNRATNVPLAKSLGLMPVDIDRDGWMDFIVANDTVQNFLFMNQRDGTFREMGVVSGVAFDVMGQARGAMGIDAADIRDNGRLGVAIGNFANEMAALYVSGTDRKKFTDEAIAAGLGGPTRLPLTFGMLWVDVDLDGRLDLIAANGHLENEIHLVQPNQTYEQAPQCFWHNEAGSRPEFIQVPAENCSTDFCRPMVGRGLTAADIDGDGDLDLLLTSVGGSPRLLRNDLPRGPSWIRLRLVGTRSNHDAIGARVTFQCDDNSVIERVVMPTRSYLSQVELPITVGLGPKRQLRSVTISWPSGQVQTLNNLPMGRLTVISEPAEQGVRTAP